MFEKLLQVDNLKTLFYTHTGNKILAADGVTFHIDIGETIGMVGDSFVSPLILKITMTKGNLRVK